MAAALARVDALYERCELIKAQEDVEKLASPLNGDELMAMFGGKPGRWIGVVKDYLLGLVLDGELAQDDKERGEALAREYIAEHPGAWDFGYMTPWNRKSRYSIVGLMPKTTESAPSVILL